MAVCLYFCKDYNYIILTSNILTDPNKAGNRSIVFLEKLSKSERDTRSEYMRITAKGQVTIPQHIRDSMGFLPETEVEMIQKGEAVYLKKKKGRSARGQKLVAHMRNRATVTMSTDQIMALTRGE